MTPKIERIPVEPCIVGEGPHWDVATQTLYFVDEYGHYILRFTPSTNKFTKASTGEKQVSFIIPVAGRNNHFVVSFDNELRLIFWDGESDKFTMVESLATATAPDAPNLVFNDGKCDCSGRLWAGTLNSNEEDFMNIRPLGLLFSFDATRQLKSHVDKIRMANGLAFNEKENKMYYIDSLKLGIDQYDFDVNTGTVKNGRVLFSLSKHEIPGLPDGMTIDTDGNLWIAIFNGSRIIKIDGRQPETLLQTIKMPTLQVTSVTFGGPNLDELYVTTGAIQIRGSELSPPGTDGTTYKITGTGSKGLPAPKFKL